MTLRRLQVAGAITLAAAILSVGADPASAEPAVTFRVPIGDGVVATVNCPDGPSEDIALDGYLQAVSRFVVDPRDGLGYHQIDKQILVLTGTGLTTGVVYRGVSRVGFTTFTSDDGAPSTFTYTEQLRFLGQGTASDFLGTATVHATINAVGELIADHTSVRLDCT